MCDRTWASEYCRRGGDACGAWCARALMEESWSSGGAPLLRTRSLPLVLEAPSGGAPTRQTKLDPRQLLTLTRHYYPEGGWGWGVAAAATLAQLLAHGLHQASAILTVEAIKRFGPEVRMQAGINHEIF